MSELFQSILVIAALGAAAGYLLLRNRRKPGCGCDACPVPKRHRRPPGN